VSKEQEPIKSDLARIDRMKDEDIDYSDIPPLEEENRPTGVDLIAALQSSPHRDIEIQPEPYFSGEDELAALLMAMVIDHCAGYSREDQQTGLTSYLYTDHTTEDDLDSYGDPTNADAMIALHEQGLIEINHNDGAQILAKVTLEGRALLDRLHVEQQRKAAASWQHPPAQ
jgi:hypothetical protein